MKSALLEELVGAVEHTASLSKDWFIQNSSGIDRTVFFERNGLGDNGTGAVYVYFDKEGTCLYVGQTGRRVKARLHDKTSPHKDKVGGNSGRKCVLFKSQRKVVGYCSKCF